MNPRRSHVLTRLKVLKEHYSVRLVAGIRVINIFKAAAILGNNT